MKPLFVKARQSRNSRHQRQRAMCMQLRKTNKAVLVGRLELDESGQPVDGRGTREWILKADQGVCKFWCRAAGRPETR